MPIANRASQTVCQKPLCQSRTGRCVYDTTKRTVEERPLFVVLVFLGLIKNCPNRMRFLQETLFVHSDFKRVLASFNEEAPKTGQLFLRHSILSTTRYRDSLAGFRNHDPSPRIYSPAFQGATCESLFFYSNCSSYGDTQNLQFERCARVAFDRIRRYRFPSKLANQVIAYAPPLLSPPGWCLRTATIQIIYPPKAVSAFPLSGGRTACRQARTDVRAVSVCRSRRVRWHNPSGIRFDWCCLVGRRHRKGFASGAVTFCRLARAFRLFGAFRQSR